MKTKQWLDYTPAERKRAGKLADKNMADKVKGMSGAELNAWTQFWSANYFKKEKK